MGSTGFQIAGWIVVGSDVVSKVDMVGMRVGRFATVILDEGSSLLVTRFSDFIILGRGSPDVAAGVDVGLRVG